MAKGSLRVNGIIVDTDGEIKASTGDSIVIREDDGSAVITVDTNGKTSIGGPMDVGVNDTGHDVKFFGATAGKSWLWDESADKMIITGDTQLTGTLTVGVDDTGHDVKFFGDAAGAYMLWDATEDSLYIRGASADHNITSAGRLVFETPQAAVVDGDRIGQIDFQASNETGADALLVSASIWAEAEDTFDATGNETGIVFATGASELAAEKMRLTSAGNVGIGTTAPNTALHLKFTDNTTNAADNSGLTHTSGIYINNESTTTEAHSSIGFRTATTDGGIGLVYNGTANQGRFSFNLEGSERMVILHNGNVGIGTTAPVTSWGDGKAVLALKGASGDNYSVLELYNHGTDANDDNLGIIDFGDGSNKNGSIRVARESATNDAYMTFWTNNQGSITERIRITAVGNVGIGTTAPSRLLHVYGSGTGTDFFDGHVILEGTTAANPVGLAFINRGNVSSYSDLGHIRMEIDSGNAKGKMTFSTRNSDGGNSDTGVRMTIKSTGNVGIGTTAPYSLLHVHGKAMGTFSMGECIYAKTITHQSNNNLNASLGINWSELSQAGTVFHMRIYGAMNTLTDAINFFECIIGYRNDFGGTLKQVITQKYASHGSTAGAAVTYDVTAVGSGNGSNAIYVTSSLQSGGSSSYDMCHYITIHRVDARSSGAMFRQS